MFIILSSHVSVGRDNELPVCPSRRIKTTGDAFSIAMLRTVVLPLLNFALIQSIMLFLRLWSMQNLVRHSELLPNLHFQILRNALLLHAHPALGQSSKIVNVTQCLRRIQHAVCLFYEFRLAPECKVPVHLHYPHHGFLWLWYQYPLGCQRAPLPPRLKLTSLGIGVHLGRTLATTRAAYYP